MKFIPALFLALLLVGALSLGCGHHAAKTSASQHHYTPQEIRALAMQHFQSSGKPPAGVRNGRGRPGPPARGR